MKVIFYFLLLTFCLLFIPHTIFAVDKPPKEGWTCINNSVWHFSPALSASANYSEFIRDCNESEECKVYDLGPNDSFKSLASCAFKGVGDPGNAVIIKPVPNPVEYSKDVKLQSTTDIACTHEEEVTLPDGTKTTKIISEVNASTLKSGNILKACTFGDVKCGLTTKHIRTCDTLGRNCNCDSTEAAGPSDWPAGTKDECGEITGVNPYNNKQCFSDITCNAIGLNAYDIAVVSSIPQCNTFFNIGIKGPPSCNANQDNGTSSDKTPYLSNSHLDNDFANNELKLNGTHPKFLNKEIQDACDLEKTVNEPTTTVQPGFFNTLNNDISGFLCEHFDFLPKEVNTCVIPVNLHISQTDCEKKKTEALYNEEIAASIVRIAAKEDCNLKDENSIVNDTGVQHRADIQTALAGGAGTTTVLVPKSIQDSAPLDMKTTASIKGKNIFSEVDPTIDKGCLLEAQSNAPNFVVGSLCSSDVQNNRTSNGFTSCKPPPLADYIKKYEFDTPNDQGYPFDKPEDFPNQFLDLKATALRWSYVFNVDPLLVAWWNFFETHGHDSYSWSLCAENGSKDINYDCKTTANGAWQLGYGQQFATYNAKLTPTDPPLLEKAFNQIYVAPNNLSSIEDIRKKTQEVGQNVLVKSNQEQQFPEISVGELIANFDTKGDESSRYWISVLERDPDISVYLLSAALKGINGTKVKSWDPYYVQHWQEASNLFADVWAEWNSTSTSGDQACTGQ